MLKGGRLVYTPVTTMQKRDRTHTSSFQYLGNSLNSESWDAKPVSIAKPDSARPLLPRCPGRSNRDRSLRLYQAEQIHRQRSEFLKEREFGGILFRGRARGGSGAVAAGAGSGVHH